MKFFFLLFFAASAFAETNSEVLDKVWSTARQNACTQNVRARFDDTTLSQMKSRVGASSDRQALEMILNPFLFSLGYSHTEFFTPADESYYLFKAYWSQTHPDSPAAPLIFNPGIQAGSDDRGYFVREALDGFPAKIQGISKGDRILMVDGIPFAGVWNPPAHNPSLVRFLHKGETKDVSLQIPQLNWSQAFQDATLSSIQILNYDSHSVGYVRLWSGVHPDSAEALWTAVRKFKAAHVDGVILDLRGGYGGALYDHLDPFFSSRQNYFVFSVTDKDGNTADVGGPEPQLNPEAYTGPLVVLINEGSRSGKEALAFQFRKSKRASLVGTATPGYFSGGGLFLLDQASDYMLYLCVNRATLDGVRIEGVGVEPDVLVPFDNQNAFQDSQLAAGLKQLYLTQ